MATEREQQERKPDDEPDGEGEGENICEYTAYDIIDVKRDRLGPILDAPQGIYTCDVHSEADAQRRRVIDCLDQTYGFTEGQPVGDVAEAYAKSMAVYTVGAFGALEALVFLKCTDPDCVIQSIADAIVAADGVDTDDDEPEDVSDDDKENTPGTEERAAKRSRNTVERDDDETGRS